METTNYTKDLAVVHRSIGISLVKFDIFPHLAFDDMELVMGVAVDEDASNYNEHTEWYAISLVDAQKLRLEYGRDIPVYYSESIEMYAVAFKPTV